MQQKLRRYQSYFWWFKIAITFDSVFIISTKKVRFLLQNIKRNYFFHCWIYHEEFTVKEEINSISKKDDKMQCNIEKSFQAQTAVTPK